MTRIVVAPYLALDGRTVEELPARTWVECAQCLESPGVDADVDVVEWARDHVRRSAGGHTRFRENRQTSFSLAPPTAP